MINQQPFERIMADLLGATDASRVTLRVDDPARGWNVRDVAAEALRPGERSLRGQTAIDQRAAATARWVEVNRRTLVQDDVRTATVRPPDSLIDLYGVRAQMLAPIVREDVLVGWVSVHDTQRVRAWSEVDQAAIEAAARAVLALLDP